MWVRQVDSATHRHQRYARRWQVDASGIDAELPPIKSSIWGQVMILRSIPRVSRLGAVLLACSALSVPAAAQPSSSTATPTELSGSKGVHFGTWGVELGTRDLSVKPGDDFQRYASGKWMDETDIPADKSSNSIGSEMNDRNQEQLREIVMGAPADSQLGAFYTSYMNAALLEQLDMKPLQADLARVDAIQSKNQFRSFMASTMKDFGSTLFGLQVIPDLDNPTINILAVGTSGMGLPDRDYYLLDKYKPQRDAYRAYIERTLGLVGTADASAKADQIMAFETEIAKLSWSQADLRDIDKLNNPMTPAQ